MITIDMGEVETYDPKTERFEITTFGQVRFEYSLKVLYEWEGKWKKPLLDPKVKLTPTEAHDLYYKMALDPVDKEAITQEVADLLSEYISDQPTATVFNTPKGSSRGPTSRKVYTSEEIYSRMFSAGIPLEFETRNLNRLLVMLRIIGLQNSPPKKMTKQEVLQQNARLNAERKARLKTKG